MTHRQRDSTAKYLYDLSKGIGLITVVGPWVTGQGSWLTILIGFTATALLFLWAYWLEGSA